MEPRHLATTHVYLMPARGDPAQHFRPIVSRVFPEVSDAFQHDRTGVADGVEGLAPGGPVDRAVAGGLVGVLPAVVVVDVGRRQQGAGREGLLGGRRRSGWRVRCRGPAPAGDGPARGGGRPARPSGCRGGRRAACSRRRSGRSKPAATCSASSRRPRARAVARGSRARPGRTTRRDGPPGRCRRPPPASRRTASGRRSMRGGRPGRSRRGRRGRRGWSGRPSSHGRCGSTARGRPPTVGPGPDRGTGSTRAGSPARSTPNRTASVQLVGQVDARGSRK